ncbi:hypothetical protein [Frondihabitans australicus]|uniref:Uncharacterized protein n=1 Tax=Frondihabitans australicus TaxID=386892 RepID=A0A495ICV2_9MICO|nr:hypothetical protein [Frondihabitans australicus]RKR73833.1 hypothetical protein C8E83_0930 [Frondihabitans australicus]
MLGDRGFFGPAQYEWWALYLVIGVLLVALVVAWFVFVSRFSRTRVPRPVVEAPRRPADLRLLQAKYAGLIDEVEAEHRAGRLGDRAVARRLSLLLRFFASEASGVDAQVMTLSDLRLARLPTVTGAVEGYYPPAFRASSETDAAEAVATAREVVRSWN